MTCPQCRGLEWLFDEKAATQDLRAYRKKGPSKTTRLLLAALQKESIEGLTLLDIGGGVGAIQHELLQNGLRQATHVDASAAYLAVAEAEAQRQGHAERVSYHFGNFVDLAPELETADIITLDRAICCYPDMAALVGLSAPKAKRLYGLVYPRDTWWMRLAGRLLNGLFWLQRTPYRFFVHPTARVEAIVLANGLTRHENRQTFLWQIAVYRR